MKNIILLFFIVFAIPAYSLADDILLDAAEKELKRSMEQYSEKDNPPYFIAYAITEKQTFNVVASFGKTRTETDQKQRFLDIDLRVGDYKFDNTHIIRGNPFSFGSGMGAISLPLDDNEKAVRNAIWFATDKYYKSAIERYEKAKTNKAVKVAEEDTSADFSREKPVEFIGETGSLKVDKEKWRLMAERLSAKFAPHGKIIDGDLIFTAQVQNNYFVNSEGSRIKWSNTYYRIFVNAKTKADDGMSLPLYESYFAFSEDGLPAEEKIAADIDSMIVLLGQLREAPLATTFTGPAILSGEASGVFFHEIFGHRVEGHREKDPNSSQTFKQSVGEEILPPFIDVIFDPTMENLEGTPLSGYYKFDDEGIPGQKVFSVKDGKFESFLMSRVPIEGFETSNGHGRRQPGYKAVARQSNLIVESDETVSNEKLREKLRELIIEQEKDYGLFFEQVSGGFTFTARTIPNAFNVTPLVVYKVYADGRPDELVRGVDLIGTPLATFANIVAAADDLGIFNGICGAESGGVPVSACSPSILVSSIETQKKKKSQAKPPILDAPGMNSGD
jgi:TldD protein